MQQHQWKSDGTESGTNLVFDLNAGTPNGNFQNPFVTADKILFVGSNGTTGGELYSLNTSDAVSLVQISEQAQGHHRLIILLQSVLMFIFLQQKQLVQQDVCINTMEQMLQLL